MHLSRTELEDFLLSSDWRVMFFDQLGSLYSVGTKTSIIGFKICKYSAILKNPLKKFKHIAEKGPPTE